MAESGFEPGSPALLTIYYTPPAKPPTAMQRMAFHTVVFWSLSTACLYSISGLIIWVSIVKQRLIQLCHVLWESVCLLYSWSISLLTSRPYLLKQTHSCPMGFQDTKTAFVWIKYYERSAQEESPGHQTFCQWTQGLIILHKDLHVNRDRFLNLAFIDFLD